MEPIDRLIRRSGFFLRRRDLLASGYNDHQIRAGLASGGIFRVRQGWYSVPEAPASAIRAVRVGGRLTSLTALESYGLNVPRRPDTHVAVRSTSCRLRKPDDRHRRLTARDAIRVHWIDGGRGGGTVWRVSLDEALLAVLVEETCEVAVACCSAALRHGKTTAARLDAVFARAPDRVRDWRRLASALDDSHGETLVRLRFIDADIPFRQQVHVPGAKRYDFKVGPRTFVEVDGAQHDPDWKGEGGSSWTKDLDCDTTVAVNGGTVLHLGYRLLYHHWPRVLAAIDRAIADDLALAAYRRRHPYRPDASRKRRRSVAKTLC